MDITRDKYYKVKVWFLIALAADMILWKRSNIAGEVIVVASVAWLLFEWTELPFLSMCSDILLILVFLLYLRANHARISNRELQELPELVVSEEMVNSAAALFRAKVNNALLFAHDITLGKDLKLFFKVAACLWLFSVVGGLFSFLTIAYVGTIISVAVSALYNRYDEHLDRVVCV